MTTGPERGQSRSRGAGLSALGDELFGRMRAARRLVKVALLAAVLAAAPLAGRADTVASLLGDFTINQFCNVQLANGSVNVHVAVVFGQLPALRELHQADTNGDGVTTQEERDAYVSTLAPGIAEKLKLAVDGSVIPLHATRWTSTLPKEQSGFSMRMDIDYAGSVAPAFGTTTRTVSFENNNFPGRMGWHEIVAAVPQGLNAFATNAFSTSLTGGLTQALQSLPANGPLDERAIHMSVTRGPIPDGANLLAPRPGTTNAAPATSASPASPPAASGWLQTQTRRLIGLISAPHVPLHVAVIALLAAMVLGALHALSPGHGKSIVGAYLVGSRGTPRHAVFLGLTVTITHTLVVFALGLATLFASQFILPERVFPVLNLVSGLLVFGMGLVLLTQRWSAARKLWMWGSPGLGLSSRTVASRAALSPAFAGHSHGHEHPHTGAHAHTHDDQHSHSHGPGNHGQDSHGHDSHGPDSHGAQPHSHAPGDDFPAHDHGAADLHAHSHSHAVAHPHPHAHSDAHGHEDHSHSHAESLMHSHGGSMHSHLPPGADGGDITWRGLLALGVSGGLLPCPSAMVLLLAAVALNKTLFGLVLVVAFSIGLAITLSAIGLAFLYARNRFQGRLKSARWPHLLPVLSAASITVLGAILCIGALVTNPL